jgi:hypothetical protein
MLAIDPLHHILPKATKVPNKDTYIPLVEGPQLFVRHSADDAVKFFLAPIKKDIEFLATTLSNFSEVNKLVTNCAKSHVAPIRCESIDLDGILQAFLANPASFPLKYLGLPLSVCHLRRIHFQNLEDKVANKLVPWIGKHATMAERTVLVKYINTHKCCYLLHHHA